MSETGSRAIPVGVLVGQDLAMMAIAAKYNLDIKNDRVQSNIALVSLFFELIKAIDIDLFVEAGAKEATASRRMKAAYPACRVVAFEANPFTYDAFEPVNRGTGVEYLHLALSDHSGPVTFKVLRDDAGVPLANGQGSLLRREKNRQDIERGFVEATVDGVTADGFFADQAFSKAAMWIDVEGACQFVLPGARAVLSRSAVLIVEVEEQAFWGEGHWLRHQVVSYLLDLGLVPVARDFEYVNQYNIVFVRGDLLTGPNRIYAALARFMSQAYPPPKPPTLQPETLKGRLRRRLRPVKKVTKRIIGSAKGGSTDQKGQSGDPEPW